MSERRLDSSFRDPAGFLFTRDGVLLRQINETYRTNYDRLMQSGLYETLVRQRLMVEHQEVSHGPHLEGGYKVIRPRPIPYVSYPYEWSFSQLKGAALLTLRIQSVCLDYGLSLKDASAYNVQFIGTSAVSYT